MRFVAVVACCGQCDEQNNEVGKVCIGALQVRALTRCCRKRWHIEKFHWVSSDYCGGVSCSLGHNLWGHHANITLSTWAHRHLGRRARLFTRFVGCGWHLEAVPMDRTRVGVGGGPDGVDSVILTRFQLISALSLPILW